MHIKLSALDLAVFVLYLIGVGVLAAPASRARNETRRDYFLGDDKLEFLFPTLEAAIDAAARKIAEMLDLTRPPPAPCASTSIR